ncbi:MAG TPA: hypothetical protein VD908_05970 [Cytophagales bacterium]|nr:hypothetical protein [Cytophagales bacterium]
MKNPENDKQNIKSEKKDNLKKHPGTGLYDLGVVIGGENERVIGDDIPAAEDYKQTQMQERVSINQNQEKKDKD